MPTWGRYEAGVSLGFDEDGELCIHVSETGTLHLLAWQRERESGEMRRAPDYDGSLNDEQAEAFRVFLNSRAPSGGARAGDWFVVSVDDANEAPVREGDRCQYLGPDPEVSIVEAQTGGMFRMERTRDRWAFEWANVRPAGGAK